MDTRAFYTRTERRIHNYPETDKGLILGLDMGYSSPKGFFRGGNFCFPSFCKQITGEQFGELGKDDIIYKDLENGSKFYVGELAEQSLRVGETVTEDTMFGRNHYMTNDFLVLARTAIGLGLWDEKPTDGSNVYIQTGLPPEYLLDDTPYLVDVFGQSHHFSLSFGKETKTFNLVIPKENVDVMHQPMGTFYSISTNVEGRFTPELAQYMRSNIMIADIGFGTFDRFIVRGKHVESKGTNPRLGMRRILDEARTLIRNEVGVDVTLPAMQECLKKGTVAKINRRDLKTDIIPITSYIERANDLVRVEAFESIKDDIFDVNYMVMTGGTGAAWYPFFTDKLKNVSTLSLIQGNTNSNLPYIYANARGYYMYRLAALNRK